RLYLWVGAADHLKLKIGDDVRQRYRRMLQEVSVALPTGFFTAEKSKDDGPLGALALRERLCQLQHCHATGGIVIRAVVDVVPAGCGFAHSQVVQVRGQEYDLIPQRGIASWNDPNHVARAPLLLARFEIELTGNVLEVAAVVACRLDTDAAQL